MKGHVGSDFPNTKKRDENIMHSGVFLTNFVVFGNVIKHSLECFIYLLHRNLNLGNRELKLQKIFDTIYVIKMR